MVSDTLEPTLLAAHDMALDKTVPAQKQSIKARNRNKLACTVLMLAMPDELILPADLASKKETGWSCGKACLIVEFFLKKYYQAGAMATFKAQTLIDAVTMGKKEDPAMIIKSWKHFAKV